MSLCGGVHVSSDVWRGQRHSLDPLGLEFQAIVKYLYVGAGIWTRILCKSSECSLLLSHVPSSICLSLTVCFRNHTLLVHRDFLIARFQKRKQGEQKYSPSLAP